MILSDLDGQEWTADEVVDLICVGSGVAALAVAIAADRAGLEVLITDDAADIGALADRQGIGADASEFLVEVTRDITVPADPGPEPVVSRPGEPDRPASPGGVLFSGAEVRDWAGVCLASPYGLLSTAVAGVDAVPIPVAEVPAGVPVSEPAVWLPALAHERDVAAWAGARLCDLVFCGGRVVGAILDTADGQAAVRATAGVVFSAASVPPVPHGRGTSIGANITELVIRPRPFSRFARLELREPVGG